MAARRLELTIDLGNAAFGDEAGTAASEVARILRVYARKIQTPHYDLERYLTDINGNRVGAAAVITEDDDA